MALGKSTAQSSTNNYNSTATGVSGNAVDGNPDTDFQNGHCSRTNAANPSWWRVDLGEDHVPVSEIFIVNRFSSSSSSNLQESNKNYTITLGEYLYIIYSGLILGDVNAANCKLLLHCSVSVMHLHVGTCSVHCCNVAH